MGDGERTGHRRKGNTEARRHGESRRYVMARSAAEFPSTEMGRQVTVSVNVAVLPTNASLHRCGSGKPLGANVSFSLCSAWRAEEGSSLAESPEISRGSETGADVFQATI